MNSTKQINSNFVDLLGIDLDEIRKKIENDILNGQSSGSGNEQTSGSGNGQTSVWEAFKQLFLYFFSIFK